MRDVLVTYATRLGAARDIAEAVAAELRSHGDHVRLECMQDAPRVDDAELVVLGSGINAGHFYPEATAWIGAHLHLLAATKVVVFNTCLNAANPAKQDEALGYNTAIAQKTGAIAHATFAGRYEKAKVGRFGQLLLKVLRKPEQDNVDVTAARSWARELFDL